MAKVAMLVSVGIESGVGWLAVVMLMAAMAAAKASPTPYWLAR
jgi:hypothetical protein